MKTLRTGGEYLRRRRGNLWLVIGLTGAAAVVASTLVQEFPMWIGAGSAMLLIGARVLPKLANVGKGIYGEFSVSALLETLPDNYFLINDVVLPGLQGNIDHVVVGPCGVVVIETKYVAGAIRVYGDTWYVKGIPRKSYSRQAVRGAAAVKEFLRREYPTLANGLYVRAVVVLSHPLCRDKIVRSPRSTEVVRYSQLREYVVELARQRKLEAGIAEKFAAVLNRVNAKTMRSSSRYAARP